MTRFKRVEHELQTVVEVVQESAERLGDVDVEFGNVAADVHAERLEERVADVADDAHVHLVDPARAHIHFGHLDREVVLIGVDIRLGHGFSGEGALEDDVGFRERGVSGKRMRGVVIAGATAFFREVVVGFLERLHKFFH